MALQCFFNVFVSKSSKPSTLNFGHHQMPDKLLNGLCVLLELARRYYSTLYLVKIENNFRFGKPFVFIIRRVVRGS